MIRELSEVTLPLNDGTRIPQLGLGVYKVDSDEAVRVVREGLEVGYRLIDTATMYHNEKEVGQAIAESGIPREDIILTTKFWMDDLGYDQTRAACMKSLETLQVDYLDFYLIHWPAPQRNLYTESWRAMEDLRDEGFIRTIGVCNFHTHHLERVFEMARVKPAINQVEIHPWLTQEPLIEFHQKHDIVSQAWSPLARGQLIDDPALTQIAHDVDRSVAQVVIRWHIQRGYSVIPKTMSRHRMIENAQVFDFSLSDDQMAAITAMNRNYRTGVDPEDRN
jgi:2,5-diketo-D-gluconate reductase A